MIMPLLTLTYRTIFTDIDTPNLQTNGFGPHLLTTPEAMNIAEQSATLIGSVARSIQTVQSKSKQPSRGWKRGR